MNRSTDLQDDCDLFTINPNVGRKDCRGDGHYMCQCCRLWNPNYERKINRSPRVIRLYRRAMFLEIMKRGVLPDFKGKRLIQEKIFTRQEARYWERRFKIRYRKFEMEQGRQM
jgi:hypothetical protein